jgi:hypothetical protein
MKPITRGWAGTGRRWRTFAVAAVLVAGAGLAAAPSQSAAAAPSICPDANVASFGPNVCVFTGTMSQAAIQNDLNSIAAQQVPVASQFDSQRYAVLFRPGTVSLLDNASNSVIDNVWAWRADHGNAVGWTTNTGGTGLVVTGADVTAYGLAVEHYQKNEVIWTGQGGTDIFFQNELPYDPPSQSAWMAGPTQNGYPAFLVTPNVRTFQGYGLGSYVVFIQTPATLHDAEAFQAPHTPGVQFHDVFGVWIAGSGGLDSIVNGVGGPVTSTNPGTVRPVDLVSYP